MFFFSKKREGLRKQLVFFFWYKMIPGFLIPNNITEKKKKETPLCWRERRREQMKGKSFMEKALEVDNREIK